ncbi:hypothetical protein VTN02DRAFT_6385 [Thermoascus thermophilus]
MMSAETTGAATTTPATCRSPGISLLPRELFLMITDYLDPRDIVRCRRVCRSWREAFGNPSNITPLLKKWFPLAREVRKLLEEGGFDNPYKISEDHGYWRRIFDQVAARYDHLARGKPRSVQRFKLCEDLYFGSRQWFQVQPWECHASHLTERVDFAFSQAFWTYEDGLLVYPSEERRWLVLVDLETDEEYAVPFFITGKVVRRIRLQDRLLVVEWAEPQAFHWLNDSDGVHRHYASAFDIRRTQSGWSVVFRSEWKIMFLGHPLSERDRFFSSHNSTHYAIYAWQPNRSLYTADEDAPIESLFVWDISKPSSYRPSLDPTGRWRDEAEEGPSIVARFSFRELGFYSVRQRGCPAIMKLDVNDEAHTVDITENICTGPRRHDSNPLEWTSKVQTTSIPFLGYGPCWRRDAGVVFPPYRGNSGVQTAPFTSDDPWYTGVSEAADEQAQVFFRLQYLSRTWQWDSLRLLLTIRTPRSSITLSHLESAEVAAKGRIYGDERFVIGENYDHELVVMRFDR